MSNSREKLSRELQPITIQAAGSGWVVDQGNGRPRGYRSRAAAIGAAVKVAARDRRPVMLD